MDIPTIVKGMTLWNWFSLIAILALPFTLLNALLSLRSRYLNWQGIQSKKKFEKRLAQLKAELVQIETHKDNVPAFLIEIVAKAMPLLLLCFTAILLFMAAFAIYRIPIAGFRIFEFLYLGLGLFLMGYAITRWKTLTRLVEIVNSPKTFGLELLDFIYTGRQKGFIIGEEDFIRSLIKHHIFTEDERVQLFNRSFDLDGGMASHEIKAVHRDNGA